MVIPSSRSSHGFQARLAGTGTSVPVKKHVAIVDYFEKTPEALNRKGIGVDIDGDGVPDLPHGEVIERLLKGLSPQLEVTRFALKSLPESRDTFAHARHILAQCKAIEAQIRSGARFDAVNLSLALNAAFSRLTLDKNCLSKDNIRLYRDRLAASLKQDPEKDIRLIHRTLESLARLQQTGTPVYAGAGNNGPLFFNLLNLAQGAVNVGAQDAHGNPCHYSADNGLINRKAQGNFAVTRVAGGYDLTGDETPEVLDHEVSGGKPVAANFTGKPANEAIATEADIQTLVEARKADQRLDEIEVCKGKLFPIFPLIMKSLTAPEIKLDVEILTRLLPQGDYVHLGGDELRVFRLGPDNKVVYDPANSGRAGVVNQITGTSLAVPAAIAEDLAKD